MNEQKNLDELAEEFYNEAMDNYESWGQWAVECYTKVQLRDMIEERGVDDTRTTFCTIEEQHQEVRAAGGLNDEGGEW